MKKLLPFLIIIFLSFSTTAQTVITVSNNPKIPAQYTNLQTAIDAATAGSTIYVHPSGETYGDVIIDKNLNLIGAGYYNPSNVYGGLKTELDEVTITALADGTQLAACFTNRVLLEPSSDDATYSNIDIENNYIGQLNIKAASTLSASVLVKRNIIGRVNFESWPTTVPAVMNMNIENNIINYISNGGGINLVIANNLFSYRGSISKLSLTNVKDANIFNNIFYGDGTNTRIGTTSGCIIDYNLSYSVIDDFSGGSGNQYGTHNINDDDPLFTSVNTTQNNLLNWAIGSSFILKTASPALASGTDGTDMGILGGNYPFSHLEPYPLPYVESIDVKNPIIGVDNTLEITIKASYPKQ